MKKTVILFLLLALAMNGFTQENKIKLKSISIALGGFQPSKGSNGNANFYFSADATFNWNKNLLTA